MAQSNTLTTVREVRKNWDPPRPIPAIEEDEFHVWLARLNEGRSVEFEHVLSDDERENAARYRFPQHRKQFVVARGLLRSILGRYLDTDPAQIRFEYNEFGKPRIAGEAGSAFKFNLSHSGDLALYAFTREREIGVDIEYLKTSVIHASMLSQCLTPWEAAYLCTLSGRDRESFFFDCWVRKEAYLKLRGDGFATPPNKIEVSGAIASSAKFNRSRTGLFTPPVSFHETPAIRGYSAVVAVEEPDLKGKFWIAG
jgi:4'-phosphopantetheinyl transferase